MQPTGATMVMQIYYAVEIKCACMQPTGATMVMQIYYTVEI